MHTVVGGMDKCGLEQDIAGEAFAAEGTRIGHLPQEPVLDPSKNVQQHVEEAVAPLKRLVDRFEELSMKLGEDLPETEMDKVIEEQGRVQDQIDAANAWDVDRTVEVAMDALRLPPGDADVATLSGGERRRVALCRLLLQPTDMLLLDEPTNHLDAESVAWLERFLQEYKGCVVAITHDRYFLDNVAGWILELDRGEGIPWQGNYSSWLEQKKQRLAVEEKAESKRQKTLQRELEWIHMSPRARQAKGQARVTAYEKLLSQETEKRREDLEIYIPPGPRLGDVVFELDKVTKGYDDRLLMDAFSAQIPPGSIVGVIGPNGAGKTTLLKMIAGKERPDAGSIKTGETVTLAYADQSRSLDGEKTVWEEISGGEDEVMLGSRRMNTRAYCASFNFLGTDQQKKVGVLSGGERNRVHLAKTLTEGANVLLLDEPTNDLDVNTLRALEEALEAFAGTAIVVSHDRWFLDRICTHILAFEGDSQTRLFLGNWSDYEAYIRDKLGKDVTPHRIKYRALKR